LDLACRDLQQGGFAGTVAADERDAVAWRDRKRRAVKQRRAAESEPDSVETKKRWRHALEFRTWEGMGNQHGAAALEPHAQTALDLVGNGEGRAELNLNGRERPFHAPQGQPRQRREADDGEQRSILVVEPRLS